MTATITIRNTGNDTEYTITGSPEEVQAKVAELFERWGSAYSEDVGTTHLSVVDSWGNAVALTANSGRTAVKLPSNCSITTM